MKRTLIIIGLVIIVLIAAAAYLLHRRLTAGDDLSQYPALSTGTASVVTVGTQAGYLKTADGRTRSYLVHIPTGYRAGTSYPLVVLLHGGGNTAQKMFDKTHFDTKADQEGFIVVAPESVGGEWADGRGTSAAELAGIDDVAFVRQLVSALEAKLSIDKKRVYATGASNGGMLSERLGCQASDVFAAIGPDVGPIPEPIYASCKPGHISVMGIQGGADPLVPIGGGEVKKSKLPIGVGSGGPIVSAADTMKKWAEVNGCQATPTITHEPPTVADGTSVDKYTYSGCAAGVDVIYDIVQGMGHIWAPEVPTLGLSGKTSHNINATDVMWAFFAAHAKP